MSAKVSPVCQYQKQKHSVCTQRFPQLPNRRPPQARSGRVPNFFQGAFELRGGMYSFGGSVPQPPLPSPTSGPEVKTSEIVFIVMSANDLRGNAAKLLQSGSCILHDFTRVPQMGRHAGHVPISHGVLFVQLATRPHSVWHINPYSTMSRLHSRGSRWFHRPPVRLHRGTFRVGLAGHARSSKSRSCSRSAATSLASWRFLLGSLGSLGLTQRKSSVRSFERGSPSRSRECGFSLGSRFNINQMEVK